MEKYYLTTAIAYTSAIPHIGNVYEAILADAVCRFKRLEGYDVRFQTGTDEHGQKIQGKAEEKGLSPQTFVDGIASEIKRIYDKCHVSYDKFVRTTDEYHVLQVQKIYDKLYEKKDIYKGYYVGHYCVACEAFYTDSQLIDKKCPDCGGDVTLQKEEAYFLDLKKYQQSLVDHIHANPNFIQPESRRNEMLNNFLKEPLPDLCISRTTFTWGIPLNFDKNHVSYVWLDALSNYITGLGYDADGKSSDDFNKFWPANVHLIGKDILRFHTIYWPIMLMALDIELPKQVFGHPWILIDKNKMSKSKGNVLYTDDLIDRYGVDTVRYYVLHEIPYAQDGNLTHELIMERNNSDLSNNLGNLFNRTLAMAKKYFAGSVSKNDTKTEFDDALIESTNLLKGKLIALMGELKVADAIEEVMLVLKKANKYIDETSPWVLAKDDSKKDVLENILYNLLETLRIASIYLQAFIPESAVKMFEQLNTSKNSFDCLPFGTVNKYNIQNQEALFARFDIKEVMEKIEKEKIINQPKVEGKQAKEEITIDDFAKVDMVVGKIIDSKIHPDAKKLLVNKIDLGNGEIRQIVSGIALNYKPEDIIGKKVIVISNLKPVKLRGVLSEGMILCAGDGANLELIEIKNNELGEKIR